MMKVCPSCHRRYESGVRFCPHDGTVLPEPVDDYVGKRLMGQFDIVDRCGQGAMGTVYRAHQVNMDRLVAIKILRRDLMRHPTVVKRFYREAKAAARLSHPNIITVHLVAETDNGTPYIVMEYLEGTDLETLCKRDAPLPIERAVSIAKSIADALSEAHGQDVIHRDLKPANIMVRESSRRGGFIKVLDFGIAKILEPDTMEESRLTQSGAIFGTPYYLSPEQASGSEIDGRSDLYSLGVILYRMATGRLPFAKGSGLDILVQHVKEPPPPPRLYRPGVPPELEAIILRALAKDPTLRFQRAAEMKRALEQLGQGQPRTPAPRESTPWAQPGRGPDPMKVKATVAGFGAASGDAPVAPLRAASVSQRGVRTRLGTAPTQMAAPAVAVAGSVEWQDAQEGREPATDELPGIGHRAAAAPAPVKAPSLEEPPPAQLFPPPVPKRVYEVTEKTARVDPPRPPPQPDPTGSSLLSVEKAVVPDARGRWITLGTVALAFVALVVGIVFIIRDRSGSRPPAPKRSRGTPPPPVFKNPATEPDAAAAPMLPQIGKEAAQLVDKGVAARLAYEGELKAREEAELILDVWRDGSRQPVVGAEATLVLRKRRGRTRRVSAKAAMVAGRYVFSHKFPTGGTWSAHLSISLPDGTKLGKRVDLRVQRRSGAKTTRRRPTMSAGNVVLPRPPPDRPRPMVTVMRPRPRPMVGLPPPNPMDPD